MDHHNPYSHQTRPLQSSAHGNNPIESYEYHPPDQLSNNSMNGFALSGNSPLVPPPPSIEQLRQMGIAMGIPPLPSDLHNVINQLQSAHGESLLPTLPVTSNFSILPLATTSSIPQTQLPGLSSLSPQERDDPIASHKFGAHVAQQYTEVKVESPNSSINVQVPLNDVMNPLPASRSFSSQNSRSSPRQMAKQEKPNKALRRQAVRALRDLIEAGVQLDDVLSEKELYEYNEVIRALYREATGGEPFTRRPVSTRGNQDMSVAELNKAAQITSQTQHEYSNASVPSQSRKSLNQEKWEISSARADPSPIVSGTSFAPGVSHSKATGSSSAPESRESPSLGKLEPSFKINMSKPPDKKSLQKSSDSPAQSLLLKPPPVGSAKSSQSREEYLAKLAAAKTKRVPAASKDESTAETKSSKPNDPKKESTTLSKAMASKEVSKDTSTISVSAKSSTEVQPTEAASLKLEVHKKNPIKTDLVKQRLEELKRATAAKQSHETREVQLSKLLRPSTPTPQSAAVAKAPSRGSSSSENHLSENVSVENFAMTQPPLSQTPVMSLGASGNIATGNGTRKRPIASDFMEDNGPPKRMFIKKHFSPEPCVIDVSDSEESDDDMELDNLATPRAPLNADLRSVSTPQYSSGVLGYSPHRPISGTQTPDLKTAERLRDIENQKRELEAKIAAMQQKKNRLAKVEVLGSTSPSLRRSFSTPNSTTQLGLNTPPNDERKQKLQKKTELESELAANFAKMEELRHQRLRLEADRNTLATELEAAGIDTEGMSMSDMLETQEKLQELQATEEQNREPGGIVEPNVPIWDASKDFENHSAILGAEQSHALVDHPSTTEEINSPDVTPSDSMDLNGSEQQVEDVFGSVKSEALNLPRLESGEILDHGELESGEISSSSLELDGNVLKPATKSPSPTKSLQTFDANLLQDETRLSNVTAAQTKDSKSIFDSIEDKDTTTPYPRTKEDLSSILVAPAEQDGETSPLEDTADDLQQDDEMDMESSSNNDTDDEGYEPELTVHLDPLPVPLADDVPELRHYREQQEEKLSTKPGPKTIFTPYESVLKQFKAYRYHPQYLQTVSQGYNSLTYSNKIDPFKPLCQFELAGGTCNDPDCKFQHFRDLGLTGTELLMQLGFKSIDSSKSDYQAGLKDHLNRAASQTGLSAESLASSIVQYRRQYVGDSSKILDLGINDSEL